MSLKTKAQIGVFEVLKVAHDKFTWNGMKYHVYIGMVDTVGKIFGSRSLDARAAFPLSTEFLASKDIEANKHQQPEQE